MSAQLWNDLLEWLNSWNDDGTPPPGDVSDWCADDRKSVLWAASTIDALRASLAAANERNERLEKFRRVAWKKRFDMHPWGDPSSPCGCALCTAYRDCDSLSASKET